MNSGGQRLNTTELIRNVSKQNGHEQRVMDIRDLSGNVYKTKDETISWTNNNLSIAIIVMTIPPPQKIV